MHPIDFDIPTPKDETELYDILKPILDQLVGLAECLHESASYRHGVSGDDEARRAMDAAQVLVNQSELALSVFLAWNDRALRAKATNQEEE